jgi:GNAT superfamily N-acetyltransferase
VVESQEIVVRPMEEREKKEVRSIANQAFGLLNKFFFSLSPNTFVAERKGELLGGIVLNFYPLPDGKRGGFVSWVFTSPNARGLGVASKLVDAAIEFFKAHDCQEYGACVEGYNVSSSKLFHGRGFQILSPGEQFRRYGLLLPKVWYSTFHFFDIGHFLWVNPGATRPDSPFWQWFGVWFLNSLFLLLAVWRINGFGSINPIALIALPAIVLLFFGSRWAAMKLAARAVGLETRYRAWETGLTLTFLMALVLGGQFPTPGSIYPKEDEWNYRKYLPKLARIALAGIVAVLALTWTFHLLMKFAELPETVRSWLMYGTFVGIPLALFDVLIGVFFPFLSFNARRVYDWNRLLWVVLATLTLALFFI